MANIIQGGDLMLFLGGKSIAFATNHSMSITAETSDISHKDIKGGNWTSTDIKQISWQVTTENLYSEDGEGNNYKDLFDAMTNRTKLQAVFGVNPSTAAQGSAVPTGGWTAPTASTTAVGFYSGEVIITSLELNAPCGDNATFTATFTGSGALTYTAKA